MTPVFPDAQEELKRALDRNELMLAYQPIVDLRDGTVGGVEALLRWNHPTHGLLWPNDFLGAIEKTEIGTIWGLRHRRSGAPSSGLAIAHHWSRAHGRGQRVPEALRS